MGDIAKALRNERLWLAAILIIAVALRAWTFRPYSIHHPDEVYQYLEQANRLIFGTGIIPWEYRAEMRSWLPPLLLSLPMRLGEALSPGTELPVVLARAMVALASLAPVVAAYAIGRRISPTHGLVAAAVLALWFENIYFSGHVLTEVLAVACILPAAALLRPDGSARATMTAGALLALAALLRFHYGPAIAIFALVAVGRNWAQWRQLVAGGVIVLALSAAVDAAMGQVPFNWIAANINENVIKGGANRFGVSGPFYYFQVMFEHWGLFAPLLLLLPLYVAKRFPALLAAAIVNLLVHMAIGHKEYRFIWLTVEILVLLSAIASVSLLLSFVPKWGQQEGPRRASLAALLLGWAGTSAALAATDKTWPSWDVLDARMRLMGDAGRQPELCGIAIHYLPYWSASYAYFGKDAPIYYPWRPQLPAMSVALKENAPGYNFVMAPARWAGTIPSEYQQLRCRSDSDERVCLYRRAGGCDPDMARSELLQPAITRLKF